MSNSTATLKSTTAITPVRSRLPDVDANAADLVRNSRDRFGQIDYNKLKTKLSDVSLQQARMAERFLTPVQRGELARKIDVSKLSAANPQMLQKPLTPVQQGELARMALTQDLSKSEATPQSNPTTRSFFSDIGDFFTGGNEDGDFFNEIGVPIAFPDEPAPAPIAPPPPKKEPIPGERVPDDDIKPTSPPSNGVSDEVPPPSSSAADALADAQALAAAAAQIAAAAADALADAVAVQHLTVQARRELVAETPNGETTLGKFVDSQEAQNIFSTVNKATEWGAHLNALSNNPQANIGFAKGFGEGVLDGVKSLASAVGSVVQFVNDSNSGPALLGDVVRGVTGRLPKWLDAIVPSAKRADETIDYTLQVAKNVAVYVATRELDNSLLVKDIEGYLSSKWDELKGDWQVAHDAGPKAEGEFFGRIAGRAVFEIAATLVPVEKVVAIGRAAAGIADLARGTAAISDVAKVEKVADAAITAANDAIKSNELAAATLEDLEKAQRDIHAFDLDRLPDTTAGQAAAEKIEVAKAKIDEAVEVGHRIETPTPGRDVAGRQDPTVFLNANQSKLLTDLQKSGDLVTITGTAAKPLAGTAATLADISKLTEATGEEFAVFTKGNERIIIRGDANGVDIQPDLLKKLKDENWHWDAHSQPGFSNPNTVASQADQDLLKALGQDRSTIINSRGDTAEFTQTAKRENFVSKLKTLSFTNREAFNAAGDAPKAYTRYEYDGYFFETDSRGRTVAAGGNLELGSAGRRNIGAEIGKEGQELGHPDDIGFHLIGDQFGGQTNRLNVVPGNSVLNNAAKGNYGEFENLIKKLRNEGKRVEVQVRPVYDIGNTTNRPDSFIASYRVNTGVGGVNKGVTHTQTFINK
jgi:hypothetical protein